MNRFARAAITTGLAVLIAFTIVGYSTEAVSGRPVNPKQCETEVGKAREQCCGEQLEGCWASCRGEEPCYYWCLAQMDRCLEW